MKQKKLSKLSEQHSKKYFEYQVCMDRGTTLFLRYLLLAVENEGFYERTRNYIPGYISEHQILRIIKQLMVALESVTLPSTKERYPSAKLNNQARRRSQNHRRA